jgi:hypothetical protein
LELNFKVHRISNESFAGGSPSHACDGRKTQELAALSLIKKEQAAARWWKIANELRCRGDAGALPFIKLYTMLGIGNFGYYGIPPRNEGRALPDNEK